MVHHLSRVEKHRVHHHTGKVLHYTSREIPTGTTTSKLVITRTQNTFPPKVQFGSKETLLYTTHHKQCEQNKAAPSQITTTTTGTTDQVKTKCTPPPR